MIAFDPILAADKSEELQARIALRRAKSTDELAAAWFANCDHFEGEAREKMQAIYTACLAKLAPMGRAG